MLMNGPSTPLQYSNVISSCLEGMSWSTCRGTTSCSIIIIITAAQQACLSRLWDRALGVYAMYQYLHL
jgi:hypothetical protein